MKSITKSLSLIFAMLIFASQSGMAFNLHYCKGALATISLGDASEVCDLADNAKACCKKNTESTHKNCCKDSNINLDDISSADVITKSLNFEFSAFYIVTNLYSFSNFLFNFKETTPQFCFFNFASNAPPLYKLYCKFILYA